MYKLIFTLSISLFALPALAVGAHGEGVDMMSWGGMMGVGGWWSWIIVLCSLVWLVVGILAAVWIWKQIVKK